MPHAYPYCRGCYHEPKGVPAILQVSVLASSSSGNSTLVSTDRTRLLIDAGLSRKETFERLAAIGVALERIARPPPMARDATPLMTSGTSVPPWSLREHSRRYPVGRWLGLASPPSSRR